jgi:hypothetical protein
LEADIKSSDRFFFFSDTLRFFTKNMCPKAMSFEPHNHQLSSSGVVGAIKNGGDRLGNLFSIGKS